MELKIKLEMEKTIESLDSNIDFIKKIYNINDMKDQNIFFHQEENIFKEKVAKYKAAKKPIDDMVKTYTDKFKEWKQAHKDKILDLTRAEIENKLEPNLDAIKGYYSVRGGQIKKELNLTNFEKQIENFLVSNKWENPFMQRVFQIATPTISLKIDKSKLTKDDLDLFQDFVEKKQSPISITMLSTAYKKSLK